MSDSAIVHATEATFADDVIEASKQIPVLVDFWAEWCGPCKSVAPVLEELAAKYTDQLKVVKMDVDANGDTAASHSVSGIPTMILFKDGGEVERTVGAAPIETYEKLIGPHVA